MGRLCSLCPSRHYARGWCAKHYQRWWRHGSPHINRRVGNGTPAWFLNNGYVATAGANGYPIYEHRVVVERELGRELHPFERVHHRNGRKTDNRLANLELWAVLPGQRRDQPAGQRVRDLVAFVVEHYPNEAGIAFERLGARPGATEAEQRE